MNTLELWSWGTVFSYQYDVLVLMCRFGSCSKLSEQQGNHLLLLLLTTLECQIQGDVSSNFVTSILSIHAHYSSMVMKVFTGHCSFQSAFDRVSGTACSLQDVLIHCFVM